MKKVLGLLLMVCLAMFSIGCGSTGGGSGSAGFTVSINADQTSGNAPLTVHFSYTCNPSSTTVTACSWAFGNGDVSTEASPTHIYNSAGTFNATLTVTNSEAKTANASKTITVTASQQPTGTITGHITDALTNGDMRTCRVDVSPSTGRTVFETNGDGFYTGTVDVGSYQIRAMPLLLTDSHNSPYASQTKTATITANQTSTVDFALLPLMQMITFQVKPSPSGYYWWPTITYKYNGTSSISGVRITIKAYDGNNVLLGTDDTYINSGDSLAPGQTYAEEILTVFQYSRVSRYTYTWE